MQKWHYESDLETEQFFCSLCCILRNNDGQRQIVNPIKEKIDKEMQSIPAINNRIKTQNSG